MCKECEVNGEVHLAYEAIIGDGYDYDWVGIAWEKVE